MGVVVFDEDSRARVHGEIEELLDARREGRPYDTTRAVIRARHRWLAERPRRERELE